MTTSSTTKTQPTQPVLDLALRHFERTLGDVTVIGTWLLTTKRPVLCLVPSRPMPTHDRVIPCLVPMDQAFEWDETTGDPQFCAVMSYQFAAALGLNPSEPRNVIFVTTLIRDSLGDLLNMPPFPSTEKAVMADVLMTDTNTGKTREAEIVDNV